MVSAMWALTSVITSNHTSTTFYTYQYKKVTEGLVRCCSLPPTFKKAKKLANLLNRCDLWKFCDGVHFTWIWFYPCEDRDLAKK